MRSVLFLLLSALLVHSITGVQVRQTATDTTTTTASDLATDLALTTLSITADTGSDSVLTFDNGDSSSFVLALLSGGSFVAKNQDYTILEASDTDKTLTVSSGTLTTEDINITGDLYYQSTQQWKLIIQENFWETPTGWSITGTSTCAGITMLGGYDVLSAGNVTKAITGLPTHTVVRLIANFHFIDAWEGEMAYLFADLGTSNAYTLLWTEWNDSTDAEEDLSICGGTFGEAKFTNLIDVTFAHTADTLNLIFGTTATDDPDVLSWGISSFEIYVL